METDRSFLVGFSGFANHYCPLRQSSKLEMSRRIRWSQNPPNMNDYDPGCLQSSAFAPFQQSVAPAPVEDMERSQQRKRGTGTPAKGETPPPKASKREPVPASVPSG